jgi:hypothetical protein
MQGSAPLQFRDNPISINDKRLRISSAILKLYIRLFPDEPRHLFLC